MKKQDLKIGIVGVGRFGSRHLNKWLNMDHVSLMGFNDIDPEVCKKVISETGLPSLTLDELIDRIDILDIVVPAVSHFQIAEKALLAGKHVFVEKPFAETPEQAQQLAKLAKNNNLKIGIGHIERFNPVYQELKNILTFPPETIVAFRQGPFIPKVGLDVSIIMELMVHDIDLVRQLIPSPIKHIHATGEILHSHKIDRATAIINFENGSEAVLFSSRAEEFRRREVICSSGTSIYKANLMERNFSISDDEVVKSFGEFDAMADELKAYVFAVQHDESHIVNENNGVDTIEIAKKIEDLILQNIKS